MALGLLVAIARPAAAQEASVEQGMAAYLEARFTDAVASFEAVLERPDGTPAEVAIAHRYLAALAVMLGEEAQAEAHARVAVALRPDVSAPEGSPPEVDALLDRVRESSGGEELRVELTAGELSRGASARVTATLVPSDVPFLSALQLSCDSAGQSEEAEGAPPEVSLDVVAEGAEVACRGSVHAASGAELVSSLNRFEVAEAAPGGDDSALIGGILGGIGGAVLVAVLVTVAVVLSAPQEASFGQPTVEGW